MRINLSPVGLAGCFADWMLTRQWKKVALYFLPLIMAGSTVGLVVAGSWLDRNKLADKYIKLADAEVDEWEKQWAPTAEAIASEKSSIKADQPAPKKIPASAELLFRRVQQLQQNDSRSMFFVAMCYMQRGATNQALNMLNRIAPTDRIGYPPAHAYLAEQMLLRPLNGNDLPIVRHHAEGALQWERTSPQLLAMISDLFSNLREPDKSVAAMAAAAKRDTKFNLLLAQSARQDPKYVKLSEESLSTAKRHFVEKLEKNPQDLGARLMLADAQRLEGDLSAAAATIQEGMKLSNSPELKSALSEVFRLMFVKSSRFDGTTWTGDLELLESAFQLDPNNPRVFEEVAKLARITGKSLNDKLMKELMEFVKTGRATSVTHMWMGEHYLQANQFAKAVPHLEQAVRRDPRAAQCWNNLAYCLADLDSNRLEEALQGANKAVELEPQVPDFHDTRGTILMKMKRPGDAVAAFERAIEAVAQSRGRYPPQPGFHERLAQAYTFVGDEGMADTHKRFAGELKASIERAIAESKAKQALSNAAAPTTTPATPSAEAPTSPAETPAPESTATPESTPTPEATPASVTTESEKPAEAPAANPAPETTNDPAATTEPKKEDPSPQ